MTAYMYTEEDFYYVREYLLLPITMDVLSRDLKRIERLDLGMNDVYKEVFESALDKASKDLHEVRRWLRIKGIKVYDEKRGKEDISAKFLCRGYENDMKLLWGFCKAETKVRMRRYMGLPEYEER